MLTRPRKNWCLVALLLLLALAALAGGCQKLGIPPNELYFVTFMAGHSSHLPPDSPFVGRNGDNDTAAPGD